MKINQFIQDLQVHLQESGQSGLQLAKATGVAQSQISGWNNEKITRYSSKAKIVHAYIKNYRKSDTEPIPKSIENAIRDVWDGDIATANHLANFIKGLKPLLKINN